MVARYAVPVALLSALMAVSLPAQEPLSTAPSPTAAQPDAAPATDSNRPITTLHSTARIVVLDVIVSDGQEHPVKGLDASAFTLTEDGVPQKLASFTEHSGLESIPSAGSSLPPNTFAVHAPISEDSTKTVIVVGDPLTYDVAADVPPSFYFNAANVPYVRNDLRAFMKTVAPGNPISIVRLDWQGMHIVQNFTSDPRVLQEAVASNRMLPPLGFPTRYAHLPGSPLQRLAAYVAVIPGHVNLVWLSAGTQGLVMANQFSDISTFLSDLNGSTNVLKLSRVTLYPINVHGYMDGPFANRELTDMATAAGGHAFLNGIKQSLSEIIATGDDFYTLSYVPANKNWNGSYRKIHVSVSGMPQPGLPMHSLASFLLGWIDDEPKIIYRRGYYAHDGAPDGVTAPSESFGRQRISYSPRGDTNRKAHHTAIQTAMSFGSPAPDQIHFTVTLTPASEVVHPKPGEELPAGNYLSPLYQDRPYRNYHIYYRIDPKDIHLEASGAGTRADELQLAAVVYRDDGLVVNSVTFTTNIEVGADDLDRVQRFGITDDQTIAMPVEGNFLLRAGVHEIGSDLTGALEVPAEWIKTPAAESH